MTSNQATELLREPEEPRPISYMELFFDLAFIFVLMQLTRSLEQDLTVPGALRALLLLTAVWWVWTVTAYSTDWFDPNQPFVRGVLVWVMLGGLLLAAAAPRAFDEYSIIFAGTYVAIHLGRGAALMHRLRGHPAARRSARVAAWFAITGVAWVVGALVPAAQHPLWAIAIVVDATIGLVGYPMVKLGRSTQAELAVSGPHLTERYRQFFIIAIGELLLVAGATFYQARFHPASTAAFILAFASALLFTYIYFLPTGQGPTPTREGSTAPARSALTTAYLHLLLLAGILTAAAGDELAILHADGHGRASYRVVAAAGAALFLAWRIALTAVTYRRVPWWLPLGLLAAVAVAPATTHLPPVATTAAIDVVLLAVALLESAKARRKRPTAPS
jgi:low temperature requirement protein LtrA